MRKALISIFLLIGFLMVQAGCMPEQAPVVAPTVQPSSTPDVVEKPSSTQAPISEVKDSPENAAAKTVGTAALVITEQRRANTFSVIPVSAGSGEPLEGFEPLVLGGEIAYGFSSDRSQMAFLSNRSDGCQTYCLRVLDLRTWEEIVQPVPVDNALSAYFVVPEFDAANNTIPIILNKQTDSASQVMLVDRSKREVTARVDLPSNIHEAAYTSQGALAVYGAQTNAEGTGPLFYLALLDGENLTLLWESNVPEITMFSGDVVDHTDPIGGHYYEPAKIFSPDGSNLYVVAADKPLLVTVDLVNKTISSAKIEPRISWLEKILVSSVRTAQAKFLNGVSKSGAIAPDGRYLYVVGEESRATKNDRGDYDMEFLPLGMQVIDTQDGALVRELATDASYLAISPDGTSLMLQGWKRIKGGNAHPWTDVLDLQSMQVAQSLEGTAYPSRLLDGSTAWLVVGESNGSTSKISLFQPGASSPQSQMIESGYLDWIVIP
jgi:hypothetical protein